jgi:hypothetical protein
MDKEIVHLEIEGELRFKSPYDFVGAGECPGQGGVVEFDFHLQDSFSVLIRDVSNGA